MNRSSKSGLALLLGTIIGAILAFIFGTDKKGETKKPVRQAVKKTKDTIRSADRKKVLDSVEKTAKDLSKQVADARKQLDKKVAQLKKTLKKVDRTKYQTAVSEVVAELKRTGQTTSKQLADIRALLMSDYKKVAPKRKSTKKKK